MPRETLVSRQRAIPYRQFFVATIAAALGCHPSAILHAQAPPVHGYITAIRPPDGFDINGEHVITTAETQYGLMGMKNPTANGPTRDALHIGAWAEVSGGYDRKTKTVAARMVLFRDDSDRKLTGLAVIDHVISTAPELVVAADGYRIRVTPATEVRYPKDVKSREDVYTGLWVLYEGKMGQDGLLLASKARFVSTDHARAKSQKAPGGSSAPGATPHPPTSSVPATLASAQPPNNASDQPEDQIDDRRTDIDLGDASYSISKDEALKSRVRRIGMSLVPTYQKQLPADDPAKIQFDFIAVKNPGREEYLSLDPGGVILVPAELAARFKNDDQLAAVLADGIAHNLQQQAPIVIQMNRTNLEWAAGMAAADLVPYAGIVAGSVYQYEIDKVINEQRWRMALELMAAAGYDPWQAPEAWRLAAPWKLPADTSSLKYPDRSGYQFAILNLMYKKPVPTDAAESGSTANTGARNKP
jgi:hypothetical protein